MQNTIHSNITFILGKTVTSCGEEPGATQHHFNQIFTTIMKVFPAQYFPDLGVCCSRCGQVQTDSPVLQLVQGDVVRGPDAGLLLPSLPLHQLLLHQDVEQLGRLVQELTQVCQRVLRK